MRQRFATKDPRAWENGLCKVADPERFPNVWAVVYNEQYSRDLAVPHQSRVIPLRISEIEVQCISTSFPATSLFPPIRNIGQFSVLHTGIFF